MKKCRAALRLIGAAVLLSFILCGCELGPYSIESLMRPPHAAGARELEKALNSILGSGFSFRVPQSGAYHTAVTMRDLNGDGQEEAIVFYSRAADPVRLCVLSQNNGVWQKVNDFSGDGSGVYSLAFDEMNGDGLSEIFVGWYMFSDKSKKSLTVYSASEEEHQLSVSVCGTESYDHYILTDQKNNGEKQLFLAYTDVSKTPNTASIKCIGLDPSGHMFTVGNLPLDPRIVRIDSLLYDTPKGEDHPRIFANALLSDNQMITDVFLWSEEQNNYYCPFRKKEKDFNTETQRGGTFPCADVDSDGLIEIPLRRKFARSREEQVATGYLLVWCGVEKETIVPEIYYAVNVERDYRLFLPKEWNGRIFVQYADAADWSFVDNSGNVLFAITAQERASTDSNTADTVLDDTSAPGVTYACRVTEAGKAFGVTAEKLKTYFEYYAGGNTK